MSIAFVAACRLLGQAVAAPSFEAVSVKLVPLAGGLPDKFSLNPRRSGGRFTWTANSTLLVTYAYHLPTWRVSGIEPSQTFYQIDATMDASATDDQVRLMLQKVLAERFKFASHRETKELQGYALVVGKNGPKIKASTTPGEERPMPDYLKGKPSAAFEGRIFSSMEGRGTGALTARGVPMARVAESLSEELGAFVVDQTGLAGNFYFGFRFQSINNPGDSDAASLFTALQDELGLRLEKQKGPVEMLVVDHIERVPTEN